MTIKDFDVTCCPFCKGSVRSLKYVTKCDSKNKNHEYSLSNYVEYVVEQTLLMIDVDIAIRFNSNSNITHIFGNAETSETIQVIGRIPVNEHLNDQIKNYLILS